MRWRILLPENPDIVGQKEMPIKVKKKKRKSMHAILKIRKTRGNNKND